MNTILKHWLNGRTIDWIASRENVAQSKVIEVIREGWNNC
jgi:hypothetical protein